MKSLSESGKQWAPLSSCSSVKVGLGVGGVGVCGDWRPQMVQMGKRDNRSFHSRSLTSSWHRPMALKQNRTGRERCDLWPPGLPEHKAQLDKDA